MKSGDLVRLNNMGRPVTFVPDKHTHANCALPTYPSGTIALILDIDVPALASLPIASFKAEKLGINPPEAFLPLAVLNLPN